jgi:eukaryotic-like serine/threonine-protein kinase
VAVDRVQSVFNAAVGLNDPDARTALLERECGDDVALRRRVELLLRAHDDSRGLPAAEPASMDFFDAGLKEGAVIAGRYKLLELIGEGGMGAVWSAEQTDPVKRSVALKLIKPGMDSKCVLARFAAERQALAIMDHPNIARVFDGGAAASGRPYFVMELVKGVPITEYCDQNQLEPRLRLELFVNVCQAVQHAHQKGIIHRDLKPSNVLVSRHDPTPIVKVIDFGVAKALGQELTDKTLFTSVGQMIGTPLYMSPEQAGMNDLDVDTRSDIYSLGVLLYELLTGTTPFSKERFQTAANDEIRRIIREEEPPTPSTRLSSSTDALPSISAQRHMEPAKLTRLVRGELDWIVMKSLEKDRGRRYESANGFAADVRRYLADEPVQACPPSAGYRLRKFARRNKGPVLAASLVLLALVVGILGTTFGMLRARAAEAEKTEALTEAKMNLEDAMAAVDQFVTRLGDECWDVPHMEPILRELRQDALKFYQKFLARKSNDPVIRREAARCYWRMGKIYFHLGQGGDANEAYLKAIAMMEEQGAATSRDPDHRSELVQTLLDYSWAVETKPDQSARLRRRAVVVSESLVADFGDLPDSRKTWHLARIALGFALINVEPDEAESILQETLRLVDDDELLGQTHTNLGYLYWSKQRLPETAHHFRLALKPFEKALAQTHEASYRRRGLGHVLLGLAVALGANQPAEAEQHLCRAISIFDRLASEYPICPVYRRDLAFVQREHAGVLKQLGQVPEADKAYRRAVDLYEKLAPDDVEVLRGLATTYHGLGLLQDSQSRKREAEDAFARGVKSCEKFLALSPRDVGVRALKGHLHRNVAFLAHANPARLMEAEDHYREAMQLFNALDSDFPNGGYWGFFADTHRRLSFNLKARNPQEAEASFRHLVELHEQRAAKHPANPQFDAAMSLAYSQLGDQLIANGRAEAAKKYHQAAEALLKKNSQPKKRESEKKQN